jgi:hypothetical protein
MARYPLITERNITAGLEVPLQYVNEVTGGIFMNFFLFAVWIVFAIGSYFLQKNQVGTGDFPVSLVVAGFVTTILAFLFRLVPGLVSGGTLIACVVATALSVLYLFFSRD